MLMVICFTADELDGSIQQALDGGKYPISTPGGLFVLDDKDEAIGSFCRVCQVYMSGKEGMFPIVEIKDRSGRKAIAIGHDDPEGSALYGVENQEFMDAYRLYASQIEGRPN